MSQKFGYSNICTALLGSVAFGVLLQGAPAMAQTQQAAAAAAAPEGIEEITVTAERHAQSIMTVPAAIQAESGTQLNDEGIKSLGDLQFITPGFLPATSSGYQQLFIRGIGNSVFVGPDPSVATYVDDVPRIWGSMPDSLSDVNRVEVLKGAQGGLYGRNATGGVVNIITRQPSTDAYEGTLQASYGEKNTYDIAGFINVPITDQLAWTFSAERIAHDPYIKNIATADEWTAADFSGNSVGFTCCYKGNPITLGLLPAGLTPAQQAATLNAFNHPQKGFGSENEYTADTKLLYEPTSHFHVTLAADYYNKGDTNGNQLQVSNEAVSTATAIGTVDYLSGFTGTLFPSFAQQPGKFQASFNDRQYTELKDWGVSTTAVYNAPDADITWINAYRGQHTGYFVDLGTSPVPYGEVDVNNEKHFEYEELRAVSTGDGPFHWLAGATYLNDFYDGNTSDQLFNFPFSPLVLVHDDIVDWTGYGQAGYDITQRLNFTASVRYLQETNTSVFSCCTEDYPGTLTVNPATVPPVGRNINEHALIPSATFNYAIDDGTVYIRWARGFKAGGVNEVANPGVFPVPTDGSEFGPEKVDTYEAGYKQNLLDHRLQLTGDVFYNKYNGLQETAHAEPNYQSTVILAIANAGSARTYGAEGSVTYQVFEPLTLGANVGYLDARYSTFQIPITTPQVLAPQSLNNSPMINSPKWQLSFTANLDQPITDRFDIVGNIVESHISSVIYDQALIPCTGNPVPNPCYPNAIGPGYWLTNLRLGVRTSDGKYEVAVYANNLFDKAYYTYGSSDAAGNENSWGNPRIVGVQLTANY